MYLLTSTGCRISEALRATWGDIGPDENGIVLRITEAKTEAGLRTIPLSPETVRRPTKRRAESPYAGDTDPIFPSRRGTPIDSHNWRQRGFNPAAERAGVPWATPHKLRHGLASLMAHEGYSAAQIAAHLGHADGGVLALRTYIHADRLADVGFADEAFSGTRKNCRACAARISSADIPGRNSEPPDDRAGTLSDGRTSSDPESSCRHVPHVLRESDIDFGHGGALTWRDRDLRSALGRVNGCASHLHERNRHDDRGSRRGFDPWLYKGLSSRFGGDSSVRERDLDAGAAEVDHRDQRVGGVESVGAV